MVIIGPDNGTLMFKIVTVFERQNNTPFFYEQFSDHYVVNKIQSAFEKSSGFLGKEILTENPSRIEIAMCFESYDNFKNFCNQNSDLITERTKLVDEWCLKTNQTYSFYFMHS